MGCTIRRIALVLVLGLSAAGAASAGGHKTPAKPASPVGTDLYGDPLPPGAVARLGTVRFRRERDFGLAGVAFLADSKTVLTAQGRAIQFWDSATGQPVRELRTEPVWLVGFAISQDGKQIAVSGEHPWINGKPGLVEVRVYDASSGKLLRTFPRPDVRNLYCERLTFSADGKLLFSLGLNGVLRAEEIDSGKQRLERKFPADYVQALVCSPDGSYLAIASGPNSRKLFLWKWREEEPRELKAPEYGARDISFSPDGKWLVGTGETPGPLHFWEVATGRLLQQREPADRAYYYTRPVFTPNGKSLVISLYGRKGSGSRIELLEPATGQSQGFLPTTGVRLVISPDSQRLAGIVGTGMRIWDLATRQELAADNEAHFWPPTHLVVSERGLIVTAAQDDIRLWDAVTNKQRFAHRLDARLGAVSLSPDGSLLAISSLDDTVRLFATDSGREIYRLPGHGRYGSRRTLAFLADGKSLLSWGDDFYLRRWDVKTGRALLEHAIRPSGFAVPDYNDENTRLVKLGPGEGGTTFSNAVFSPDGRTLMMQVGGHFHAFDVQTGKEKRKIASPLEGGYAPLTAPDGRHLLAGLPLRSADGNHDLILWGPDSGERLRLRLPGDSGSPLAFSPDGRSFATALDSPAEIRVFETSSGQERRRIKGFRSHVRSLAFLPDGRRLASGMSDSTILIWDLTAPARE